MLLSDTADVAVVPTCVFERWQATHPAEADDLAVVTPQPENGLACARTFPELLPDMAMGSYPVVAPVIVQDVAMALFFEASGIHVGEKQPAIPANLRLDNSFDGLEMLH